MQEHSRHRAARALLPLPVAALVLAVPWVAMQFTAAVRWSGGDFLVFGLLLLVACGNYAWFAWRPEWPAYRGAAAIAVAGGFLMVWTQLAVGIVGSESDPVNIVFGGVLAVGIIGAWRVRLQPAGMVHVMRVMAAAQGLAAAIALIVAGPSTLPFTLAWLVFWLASAWLFRRAAQRRTAS